MTYAIQPFANAVKQARVAKGMSQRDLSAVAGIPQGHISKIERGTVDLKLSSLIGLSRLLDLEVVLVPRRLVPVVESLVRGSLTEQQPESTPSPRALEGLRRIGSAASSLQDKHVDDEALNRIIHLVAQLRHMNLASREGRRIDRIARMMELQQGEATTSAAIQKVERRLQDLRNALARRMTSTDIDRASLPAYRLEEDDSDA